jgi:hypothetical protein
MNPTSPFCQQGHGPGFHQAQMVGNGLGATNTCQTVLGDGVEVRQRNGLRDDDGVLLGEQQFMPHADG